jgi:bifunctional N-acetylglucosamine-1-phosphate-uridyltransferase/glucosamine-1-phosphate-acetyltransferase GlmU-like protein
VVHILADAGQRVETVQTENIEKTLGINDRGDLELAERIKDIARTESVSEPVDASIVLGSRRRTSS